MSLLLILIVADAFSFLWKMQISVFWSLILSPDFFNQHETATILRFVSSRAMLRNVFSVPRCYRPGNPGPRLGTFQILIGIVNLNRAPLKPFLFPFGFPTFSNFTELLGFSEFLNFFWVFQTFIFSKFSGLLGEEVGPEFFTSNTGCSGTVAEWVRASALLHSEWMVPSLNPGEGRIYFFLVGNGVLNCWQKKNLVSS